jgi:hypothetical protein
MTTRFVFFVSTPMLISLSPEAPLFFKDVSLLFIIVSAMKIESPGGFSAGAFPPDSRRMRSLGSTDCILLGISFGALRTPSPSFFFFAMATTAFAGVGG